MAGLVRHIRDNGIYYLFIASYGYLVFSMTTKLWFGGGVNIFATYSDAQGLSQVILDANKVYWSKTSFLFLTILLLGLRFDFRAAVGSAAMFWAGSLIIMFGASMTLLTALVIGISLVVQQVVTGRVFSARQINR